MLKTICTHPQIIAGLALCGHGDKVLIADGNYPVDSNTNGNTEIVYLNLSKGLLLVTDVLNVVHQTVAVEKAEVMMPDDGDEPSVFSEFRKMLGPEAAFENLGRFEFYDACKQNNIKLAIATGEQRLYANILLTVGPVK